MTPLKQTCILAALLLTLFMASLCPAGSLSAQENSKEALLSAIETKYAGKGFSADFAQTARLAALDMTEKATGKAWFSHPGRMKWQYLTPDRHEIITNGIQLWIFRPDENQVMTGSAAAFFKPGTGGDFLSDISRIRENFTVTVVRQESDFSELALTPRKETPDLARALITVAMPSHEIQMVVTENAYGDTTRFVFTNIRFNTPDPVLFNFSIPDGTSVIEME